MNLFRRSDTKPFQPRQPLFSMGAAAPSDAARAQAIAQRDQARRDAADAQEAARRERVLARERERAARRGYAQGRREEQARHRGHPFLMLLLAVGAAACAFVVYLAVQTGSFTGAGQVIDQKVAVASQKTTAATQTAENRAGDALQNAGAKLKQ